jgi:hypothetical protein
MLARSNTIICRRLKKNEANLGPMLAACLIMSSDIPSAEDVRHPLRDVQITPDMVLKKIRALKPASAPGPDGIGAMLLKELADYVVGPLTTIYRSSMASGDVPEDWRVTNVTPIYTHCTRKAPRLTPATTDRCH